MKRTLCIILVVASFLCSCALAESIDLSSMSIEELAAPRDRCLMEIMKSDKWQEVTVPQGVWKIGTDIPAGHWTLRMSKDAKSVWCGLTYCSKLDDTGLDADWSGTMHYEQLARPGSDYPAAAQLDIELKEGMYLIIGNTEVVFSPYTGKPDLGFK